jgi:menaquinone-9 beta-reductase
MSSQKPITIVGGGLAGLALGIGLRQRDIPVTIREAGNYPRHRVCGEFISGNGQTVLERLGVLEHFQKAGAICARTVIFVCGKQKSPVRALATSALCLSRYKMDALLAEEFQQLGGDLRVQSRWNPDSRTEGTVFAWGRRLQSAEKKPGWFGVKAHISSPVNLEADLEMHLSPDGYIGVSRVEGHQVNVCGLFRARPGYHPDSKTEWLRGPNNSLLRERLNTAQFEADSFCSVAGIQLKPQRALIKSECNIGDALTMTPPVTGNGMSMALESAEAAIEPLAAYSRGQLDWAGAQHQVALRCDAVFSRRLAWARILQWMIVSRAIHAGFKEFLLHSNLVWRLMFAQTR